jgi:hypothetical protein
MKVGFLSVIAVIGFFTLMCGLDYSGLMWESFIGPKRENVRRNIFEQTKSYNQGAQQELSRLYVDFQRAKDPQEKKAIAGMVRHEFADYNIDLLNGDLRAFVAQCMNTF